VVSIPFEESDTSPRPPKRIRLKNNFAPTNPILEEDNTDLLIRQLFGPDLEED